MTAEPKYPTCEAVGECPKPTHDAAPYHHFYWNAEVDVKRMNKIFGKGGRGHDDPETKYGSVICKTCGKRALVLDEAEDFPTI